MFGVVGCGRIGTATALRAKALGFQTCFCDPYLAAGYDKAIGVARAANLEELLDRSDVVSLHTPLNAETRHLIDAPQLKLMKKSAYLVNTARGGVVGMQRSSQRWRPVKLRARGWMCSRTSPRAWQNCCASPTASSHRTARSTHRNPLWRCAGKSALTVREALLRGKLLNVVNLPGTAASK